MNDTLAKWGFEIWPFSDLMGQNDGKNNCEVHISKPLAKMAINWHKIGQIPLLRVNITYGHNLVIFHPIFTFLYLNALFLKRKIKW